jgi:hypothetical protein
MNRKWLGIVVLVTAACVLSSLSSCGRSQQLVSIQIQPPVETVGSSTTPVADDAGAQVHLQALGTYIHPPVTKDVTSQVTWSSNTPQMFTVDSTGLLTATGQSCGGTLVSATVTTNSSAGGISSSGAAVVGYMTANVTCYTGTGGGGGGSGPTITVTFLGTGAGTITSSPSGVSCASSAGSCTGTFASGATVILTAVPSGTFGGWGSCDSVDGSGLMCTINNLTAPRALTATFN